MTASNAIGSLGAAVSFSTTAYANEANLAAVQALSYTAVGDLQNVPDFGVNTDFGETTILAGNGWKSRKPLNHDLAQMSLDVNFVPTDTTQIDLLEAQLNRTKLWFKVEFPDGTEWYIPGYVGNFKSGIQENQILKASFTVQPDGEPFIEGIS